MRGFIACERTWLCIWPTCDIVACEGRYGPERGTWGPQEAPFACERHIRPARGSTGLCEAPINQLKAPLFSGRWQHVRGASGGCEYMLAFAILSLVRSNILLHVSLPAAPTLRNLRYSHHLDIRSLAEAVPGIVIQDRAPSTVRKYSAAFSAWQKWAEPKGIKVLPTSGPEFSLYLVHLLQTTASLASIRVAAFGVAWAHQKSCLPSPSHHTLVKQLLEACTRILGTCPKNRKMPITADQVKEVVRKFGGGNLSELQIRCLISIGFAAFLRWDDLKDLRRHDLLITGDHMSISLAKRKNDQFREGSLSWSHAAILRPAQ